MAAELLVTADVFFEGMYHGVHTSNTVLVSLGRGKEASMVARHLRMRASCLAILANSKSSVLHLGHRMAAGRCMQIQPLNQHGEIWYPEGREQATTLHA
jgi:hypothetical protein